jgi:hypothetical protein
MMQAAMASIAPNVSIWHSEKAMMEAFHISSTAVDNSKAPRRKAPLAVSHRLLGRYGTHRWQINEALVAIAQFQQRSVLLRCRPRERAGAEQVIWSQIASIAGPAAAMGSSHTGHWQPRSGRLSVLAKLPTHLASRTC